MNKILSLVIFTLFVVFCVFTSIQKLNAEDSYISGFDWYSIGGTGNISIVKTPKSCVLMAQSFSSGSYALTTIDYADCH